MARHLVDDGLFQRFTTVHVKPSDPGIGDDVPLNIEVGRRYCDLHEALRGLAPPTEAAGKTAKAYFDEDARTVRVGFKPLIERLQVDQTLPTIIRETAPKWSGLLARIALVFHLVEIASRSISGEEPTARDLCAITGHTVDKAASFLRRIALPNLFRLGFETMPEEGAPAGHARWIAGHILAHKLDTIAARDIGRAYRPLRGKPIDTHQAMDVLGDAGWTSPAPARSDSMRWSVNPAVHTLFEHAAKTEKERRERIFKTIRANVADL
jgi:hypothetical protein